MSSIHHKKTLLKTDRRIFIFGSGQKSLVDPFPFGRPPFGHIRVACVHVNDTNEGARIVNRNAPHTRPK